MSQRKWPKSYSSKSSLHRSVKAQLNADLHFIANETGNSSNSEFNLYSDIAVPHQALNLSEINVFHDRGDDDNDNSNNDVVDVDSSFVASHSSASVSHNFHSLMNADSDLADGHMVDFSSDDEEASEESESDTISIPLREWAVKYSIPLTAVGELLFILKPYCKSLPLDARTLLKTPKSCEVKKLIGGGEYCHLGLVKGLENVFKNRCAPESDCVESQFNVDGVPLFKSSNSCLWPILCMVKNPNCGETFVVGVY